MTKNNIATGVQTGIVRTQDTPLGSGIRSSVAVADISELARIESTIITAIVAPPIPAEVVLAPVLAPISIAADVVGAVGRWLGRD